MNLFGTLLAWANGFMNHTALPTIAKFAASIIHDELPVAEQFVRAELASIPADLVASKPLVAFAQVSQQAAAAAAAAGATIGMHSIVVATSNAIVALQGNTPVTQVDASAAINQAAAKRDAAVAAANAAFDKEQADLSAAADKEAKALAARVSS